MRIDFELSVLGLAKKKKFIDWYNYPGASMTDYVCFTPISFVSVCVAII